MWTHRNTTVYRSLAQNRVLQLMVNFILIFHYSGKLYEGKDYFFRVAAENSVGLGNFAELTTAVVTKPAVSKYSLRCLTLYDPTVVWIPSIGHYWIHVNSPIRMNKLKFDLPGWNLTCLGYFPTNIDQFLLWYLILNMPNVWPGS